jgi:hypothetical protein
LSIEKEMINRIKFIEWCSNCGSIANIQLSYENKYVSSWSEAKKYYKQTSWEDKTLEAQNELTSFLFNKYRNEYSKWNSLVKEAKKFIEEEVVPKIKKIEEDNDLDTFFIDCVKWDILGAIMENEYKKCNGGPTFFLNLLEIYEVGNFPCGWDNSKKNGELIVF